VNEGYASPARSDSRGDGTATLLASFRFTPAAEAEFKRICLERNIPRARIATAIYLTLILIVTALNAFGTAAPLPPDTLRSVYLLRMGVACPALIVILCATEWRFLKEHYQAVVGSAVTVTGISVMTISALAASSGTPQFQMGDVLVLVYACLFLGLRFRPIVVVATVLLVAFGTIGFFMGVPPTDLSFAGAVIFATTLMGVLSARRVENLERTTFIENRLLNEQAERDGLTGLFNRRKFDSMSVALWEQACRDGKPIQIILVDIDSFKSYNDHYGHQAGDDCIRIVAGLVAESARRPLDFCARYGGEEFVLMLYGVSDDDAFAIADNVRATIELEQIPHAGSPVSKYLTVSVGSAIGRPGTGRSLAGFIQEADEALYQAKESGRNAVVHRRASEAKTGAFKILSA
jgi:diguanylate cyclase (GGDEF)-like protein